LGIIGSRVKKKFEDVYKGRERKKSSVMLWERFGKKKNGSHRPKLVVADEEDHPQKSKPPYREEQEVFWSGKGKGEAFCTHKKVRKFLKKENGLRTVGREGKTGGRVSKGTGDP